MRKLNVKPAKSLWLNWEKVDELIKFVKELFSNLKIEKESKYIEILKGFPKEELLEKINKTGYEFKIEIDWLVLTKWLYHVLNKKLCYIPNIETQKWVYREINANDIKKLINSGVNKNEGIINLSVILDCELSILMNIIENNNYRDYFAEEFVMVESTYWSKK
ncbi:MAG: hypothetical protein ACD_4C00486G0013 [uncultured bacterium (gcode 4)]|uniref:Uncharacterized protein n=1 Tax=uncultured bacterium (gcode 4) TaxID=1234023 RepID=K2FSU1_9BACT|nr:MAG: hypothetical protein ACD_4C00486G0013 [uncultured bacterium (gcode 4)]